MWATNILIITTLIIHSSGTRSSPPRIVKEPSNDEIFFHVVENVNQNERPLLIECEAEGQPEIRYRWTKNNENFNLEPYDFRMAQQPGRGTIVITSPRNEDAGQYQCYAENMLGTATSNSVFVRKAELKSFPEENIVNISIEEGKPCKLQCTPPYGSPKPSVHWITINTFGAIKSINNSRITIDPEGNLWFSNVTIEDSSDGSNSFFYACSVSSPLRNEYKLGNRIFLRVTPSAISPSHYLHEPVRQYVSKRNESALQGKRAELFCIFGGTPLPQIIWRKNRRLIQWNERVQQGNYGRSVLIRSVILEDESLYTCEVSNGVGNGQSHSINLRVLSIPRFTMEPEIINSPEDELIQFHCHATGIPEPSIKWTFNGNPLEEVPNIRRSVTSNRIEIRNVLKSDIGNYGCNATNSIGYVYKDVYLNVLSFAPEILDSPGQQATVVESSVTMHCKVFGVPKPQIKWFRNGIHLTGSKYKVLDSGDLNIEGVEYYDQGDYTCQARNKFGQADVNGKLTVKDRTQIILSPTDTEATVGASVTLRCNAVTDPSLDLKIEWLQSDIPINFEIGSRFSQLNDNSLNIHHLSTLDSGIYTCLAKTEIDEVPAKALLIVHDVPSSPLINEIQCNGQDAVISWRQLGDNLAPILHYSIQYNTSFTPDTWSVIAHMIPATDSMRTVHLSPWTNYTFNVIAHNRVGPSNPSLSSETCNVLPHVPHKNPENVEGKGTEPNNLVISWKPMPEIEHNGPGFYYRVSYKRDGESNGYISREIHDWMESSLTIPDMPTYTKYLITVAAVNDYGESNSLPREITGYSGEDVPEKAPLNFCVSDIISGSAAILSWQPVSVESVRGNFRGYKIETWTDSELKSDLRELHVRHDSITTLFGKFRPAAKNYATISVFNGRFKGPPSNTISMLMPVGKPGAVESLDGISVGNSMIQLKWKKPREENGELTGYKLYYQIVNGTLIGEKIFFFINNPHINTVKVGELLPDQTYRFGIQPLNAAGEGYEYFIERRTKQFTNPEIPNFFWERYSNENGFARINIFWNNSFIENAGSHVYVKFKKNNESIWKNTTAEYVTDYIIVNELSPEAKYHFVIIAVNNEFESVSEEQEIDLGTIDEPGLIDILGIKKNPKPYLMSMFSYMKKITHQIETDNQNAMCNMDTNLTTTVATAISSETYDDYSKDYLE